ncbi:MAG: tandem-95 repeat protein, partial [Anaerolineales bacterium]|nr:tandem-95 repeat protein [Anaerolineales bacterium]
SGTPAEGDIGGTITVTATDAGGLSVSDDFDITVTAVNDAPVAADDSVTVAEDDSVVISVLTNDNDIDGTLDLATVTVTSGPANGTVTVNTTTGEITYTPDLNFNGNDSFTYVVADNEGALSNIATVTITVSALNDAPDAVNDGDPTPLSTPEDAPLSGDISTNDVDVDGDTLTYSLGTNPAHGTVLLAANGTFSYTPAANYNGSDSFTYSV